MNKRADNTKYAHLVVSAEMLLADHSFNLLAQGLIEALENRKSYLKREGDVFARQLVDSQIEKIKGLL